MSYAVGTRVGAIESGTETHIRLFGYGVYQGDHEPYPGAGRTNPKIVLDNGDVIWGMQCWWGPEDQVKAKIGTRTVEIVPVPEAPRALTKEERLQNVFTSLSGAFTITDLIHGLAMYTASVLDDAEMADAFIASITSSFTTIVHNAAPAYKERDGIPAHMVRVLTEYTQLGDRKHLLTNFIAENPVFHTLPDDEKDRLLRQSYAMADYGNVLAERLRAAGVTFGTEEFEEKCRSIAKENGHDLVENADGEIESVPLSS